MSAQEIPAWKRHAVWPHGFPSEGDERPKVAVVIDDLGLNRRGTDQSIALPAPLTLAFMTYAEGLAAWSARASAAGHELLLHVPMEPLSSQQDAGPHVLSVDLSAAEITRRLEWGLSRFDGFVGINNHMGSRFTASRRALRPVMDVLRRHGLLFLDSRTTGATVAAVSARDAGVPLISRDIFLDHNVPDQAEVMANLARLEALARKRGHAVAIGHPHPATMAALTAWLPGLAARGIDLVPLTSLLAAQRERKLAWLPQN